MEIIGENKKIVARRSNSAVKIYAGSVLIVFGIVLLLNNFDLLNCVVKSYLFSWHMALVLFGGLMLAARKTIIGATFVLIGIVAMLVKYFGVVFPLEEVIIPAILMIAGISILINNFRK